MVFNITIEEINIIDGSGLLINIIIIHYNQHLKSIYPNYEWIPWKFHQIPKNYWSNIENQRKYFDWLSNQINFKSNEDWYKLKREILIKYNGSGLLKIYNDSSTTNYYFNLS